MKITYKMNNLSVKLGSRSSLADGGGGVFSDSSYQQIQDGGGQLELLLKKPILPLTA